MAITLSEAQKILMAAMKQAESIPAKMSFAIVDPHGDTIAIARMDGARSFTTEVAKGKAMVSATFNQFSGAMAANAGSPIMMSINASLYGNRLMFVQGAVPIVRNGEVQGAVGVSGGSAQQDEDCAKAGLAAL